MSLLSNGWNSSDISYAPPGPFPIITTTYGVYKINHIIIYSQKWNEKRANIFKNNNQRVKSKAIIRKKKGGGEKKNQRTKMERVKSKWLVLCSGNWGPVCFISKWLFTTLTPTST